MEKPDLSRIPDTPGVYQFINAQGRIIYVGKAKNLRRRLASYFRPEHQLTPKTRAMVAKAERLETISTSTDNEAFLLESSLIKKHRPRYNIVLRDDKDYMLFRIAQDTPYPRLEIVRQGGQRGKSRRKARFFGPFSSGRDAKATWKAIHKAFPLRRCTDKGMKNRTKPCLYYHIKQCPAPCVLDVKPEDYARLISKVIMLLEGKSKDLINSLQQEMLEASETLDFERAAELRDQMRAVESTVERQAVVLENERDLDAVGLMENQQGLGLGLLIVRGGTLLGNQNYFWPGLGLDDAEELLLSFLLQYYVNAETIPAQILLPWLPGSQSIDPALCSIESTLISATGGKEDNLETGTALNAPNSNTESFTLRDIETTLSEQRGGQVRITLPRPGAEADLVCMAAANARDSARKRREDNLPEVLASIFMRQDPVERIEAVDVSHTSGAATRAAMVVFENGHPLRSDWRSYAFEEGGGDDYAVLAAWAERRAMAGPPWPDLMLIDGGRGQLTAVYAVFAKHGLEKAFTLAGIAKARDEDGHSDRRAGNVSDRIFLPGRSNPLNIKPGSPELLYLQHVRNHVHDFVIGRHRKARSSLALQGELSRIPGFGPSYIKKLWEHFDSLQQMAAASDEDLQKIPGMGKARINALREHLKNVIDRNNKGHN
ncbi:excinuclease ABC subunit UvrC [Desulfovibrio sp. OttesenSCG-928-F07]|nr:excinuclease ABC subunit UvrC [Desulfovibrio sp. OttesenSCG-928-F07]